MQVKVSTASPLDRLAAAGWTHSRGHLTLTHSHSVTHTDTQNTKQKRLSSVYDPFFTAVGKHECGHLFKSNTVTLMQFSHAMLLFLSCIFCNSQCYILIAGLHSFNKCVYIFFVCQVGYEYLLLSKIIYFCYHKSRVISQYSVSCQNVTVLSLIIVI